MRFGRVWLVRLGIVLLLNLVGFAAFWIWLTIRRRQRREA